LSYIDTSVIILALDPTDPRSVKAREELEKEGNKIISELVLTELSAVLSRKDHILKELRRLLGVENEEVLVKATILYVLKRFNLVYRSTGSATGILLGVGEVYKPMLIAINTSIYTRLKALDLLHLAYVKSLIDSGERINHIVTGDADFKKVEDWLTKNYNVKVKLIT
jgi:predicted nucleic acid-binding protein